MNLADRIKKSQQKETRLIVTAGVRFAGKTAGLGTLPGKTLLAITADKESGAMGAVKVAEENGNQLDFVFITDAADALSVAKEALGSGYDNVAVDGLTAITEVEAEKPGVAKLLNSTGNGVYAGWRAIGNEVVGLIQDLKALSADTGKPIVLTLAFKDPKPDASGTISTLEPDIKGQMALSVIKGKCPFFVCAKRAHDKDGNPLHVLQTAPDDIYPARLDGVMAKDLPKGFRTERDKVEEDEPVGYDALLKFLNSYTNKGE